MILLIDIGNTRLKWARLEGGELGQQQATAHTDADRMQMLDALFATTPKPARVLISNVGGPEVERICAESIKQRWQIEPEFIVSSTYACGVRNAYREPSKLGVDRWLAMIAVHSFMQRAACVVSAGTAMTIDGIDANGEHLGGVIVPGPQLMIEGLLANTSDIAPRMSDESTGAFALLARDTGAAVRQGCAHALGALIEKAYEEVHAKVRAEPTLVLTGGASDFIAPAIRIRHERIPDLVLRGLAVIAREQA